MSVKGPTIKPQGIGAQGNPNHDQKMDSSKGTQFDHLPSTYDSSKPATSRSTSSAKSGYTGKGSLPNKTYDHLPNGRNAGPMRG